MPATKKIYSSFSAFCQRFRTLHNIATQRAHAAIRLSKPATGLIAALFLCCAAVLADNTAGDNSQSQGESVQFLDVDDAFELNLDHSESGTELIWVIAPEYYLYKHKFKVLGINSATGKHTDLSANMRLSKGLRKNDGYYGMVEVYYYQAVAKLGAALQNLSGIDQLEVSYQGCANAGLCYPVQTRKLSLAQ